MTAARRRSALAGLAATALLAAGCGGDPPPPEPGLDQLALERSLTSELARRTGTVVEDMACPPVQRPRAGLTFECSALFDGEPGLVVVTLTDASGRPRARRARLKNLLLGRLELAIQGKLARLGTPVASVDCPGPVPQRRGQVSYCEVEDRRGRRARLRVTQTDDEGHVRFTQVPREQRRRR